MTDDQRWRDPHAWDDEPIGVVYSDKRYRWAHRWSEYLVILVGGVGAIAAIGAAVPFSVARMTGAAMILAASFAFSRSDRAHRSSVRRELLWDAAGVVLLVGGLLVFGFS
jgi:hypothetical protein